MRRRLRHNRPPTAASIADFTKLVARLHQKPDLASDRPRRQADGRLDGDAPNPNWGARRSASTGSLREAFTASTDHGTQHPVGVLVAFCGKSREDFAERDVNFLPALRPNSGAPCRCASSASGFSPRCAPAGQLLDDAEDAVVVLDGALQVIDANAAARVLLHAGDGPRLRHRRLFAQHPDEDAKLQALLRLIVLERENVE